MNLKAKGHTSFQGRVIGLTALLVTSVFWSQGTDPFNLPKLFILTLGASLLLGSLVFDLKKLNLATLVDLRFLVLLTLILGLAIPFFFSGAPSSQMIYGAYGRNTGLLCYLALGIVYLTGTSFVNLKDVTLPLKALAISFFLVAIVCTFEILGLNPQGINESIKMSLIGTFGNSNFVSAFMGISGIVSFTLALDFKANLQKRLTYLSTLILSAFFISRTESKQGFVVLIGGCLLIFGIFLFKRFESKAVIICYSFFFTIGAVFSIAGLVRVGPLADLIYKSSISYRFEYWKAGIEMFKANPIKGVGLNSYGDWYRFFRSENSLVSPGVSVFTNTAHNVYIDLAATGGVFLLISYILIVFLTLRSTYRFMIRNKEFDVTFFALFGAWVVYLVQASVSIDQIGLAFWGWILPGLIFSYEKIDQSRHSSDAKSQEKRSTARLTSDALSPQAVIGSSLGLILGIVALVPALQADFDLRKAYDSTSAQLLINAANQSPQDSSKSASIAAALFNNNLPSESLAIAKSGVANNPMSFDLWKLIYLNNSALKEERIQALNKMKFIDPLNSGLDTLKLEG
jgi:O-antigen ligase